MRDKKKWFAVHFGRTYFTSPPLHTPSLVLGLALPLLAVLAISAAVFLGVESSGGLALTMAPAFGIKELHARRADITKEIDGILSSVDVKTGLTEEQRGKIAALKSQRQTNEELITLCEEQMEAEKSVPIVTRVVVGKDNSEDDPKGGFKDHKDFLRCVMQVGRIRVEDPRLRRFRAVQGSDEQQAGQDPYGGYFLPIGIAPGVLTVRPEDDPTAALVTPVPMEAPTVAINARVDKDHTSSVSGGLTVTRKPETVDATSSRMQFEQIRLTAHDLFGLVYATENILTDSPQSFIAILSAGFSDEFAAKLLYERLHGTGVGEFLGVMNSPCKITVSKEGSQSADTILKQNIDKMIARCWRYGRAVWLANHSTYPQLASLYQLVGTTGGSVVQYLTGAPGGQQYLVNRPIFFTEHCAALGDLGDIVLGVWSEFLEGTYQRLQQAESIHVRFVAHERTFKFWLRNDGQPWWSAALTPKNGDTLSPFVTLQAR